jgi:ADP-ribosylglycohydrolase
MGAMVGGIAGAAYLLPLSPASIISYAALSALRQPSQLSMRT